MIETMQLPSEFLQFAQSEGTFFEHQQNMDAATLTNFQAKITYIGEQRKPLPTIVVTCDEAEEAHAKAPSRVFGMRVAGLDCGNDDLTPMFCTATRRELSLLTQNLSRLPTLMNAAATTRFDGAFPGIYLVLTLFNKVSEKEYRLQAVLGQTEAKPLLDAMGRALITNDECRHALFILWRGLGFHIGVLDPDTDGDGASNGREASWGTDPNIRDSDGDGMSDGDEILAGTDPLNPFFEYKSTPTLSIADGPFRGSKVVEITTSPDLRHGHALLELKFTPEGFLPPTNNLFMIQIFRRTAVKVDGVKIPILPSLYIEYAGSPELDLHTVDGATVDHKVGELDPFYNGRDPQDRFAGAEEKQRAGLIDGKRVEPTTMIYRCRTYEDHWRALNPEGIREVRFEYETAAFCESGEGQGYFLGVLKWSWGKKRGSPVTACIESVEVVDSAPTAQVQVAGGGQVFSVPVFLTGTQGQPSTFFSEVLALWLKNHKYAWPGPKVKLSLGVDIIVPQPASIEAGIEVTRIEELPYDGTLAEQGLQLLPFGREIVGTDRSGVVLPWDYFPFGVPLTITFRYSDEDVEGLERHKLGIVRFDERTNRYTSKDLYVLRKDAQTNSITFCTSRFGRFAMVGKQ
jgi:hypothetical protein